ncbi:hypothetical protein HPHPP15B_1246 [Helicobacter pylori Hp P-15b]|nr:hypothetical protein HPHPP15B_1246 [Helicobacter pylori Hp P-15b]
MTKNKRDNVLMIFMVFMRFPLFLKDYPNMLVVTIRKR